MSVTIGPAAPADLLAGWTFDQFSGIYALQLDPRLKRPVTANGRAFHLGLPLPRSNSQSWQFDNPLVVSPSDAYRRLPFAPGEVWKVIQAPDSPGGSHNGYAAYAYDFGKVGYDADGNPQIATQHEPVVAATDGTVINVVDLPAGEGKVHLQVLSDERESYIHTDLGSFVTTCTQAQGTLFLPTLGQPWTYLPIAQGDPLVRIDAGMNHLHFGASAVDGASYHGIPSSFHQYEYSEDEGATWHPVSVGLPKGGQWVRNP
jgi:hypothetical protein